MARLVLTDCFVTINSVNLSDHISSITLSTVDEIIDTSAFGVNARQRIAGLPDNSVTLEFHQDYAAASVEATINGSPSLIGTVTTIVVKPNGSTTSSTNPSFTFSALCSEWTPVNGEIGSLASISVTWPISGVITKALV